MCALSTLQKIRIQKLYYFMKKGFTEPIYGLNQFKDIYNAPLAEHGASTDSDFSTNSFFRVDNNSRF